MRPRSILMLFLVTAAATVNAGDVGSGVYVGGFVSQGYLNSEDNDYLLTNGRDGSGAFNEAAVIVSAEPADRLRVGIQFMGRDFGSNQTSSVVVDWAYGDYRWFDQLGFRAGRIKLPYGLYNQERDVDMLRTSVLLPQSVYSELDRNLLIAYEGAGLYGNFALGSLGDLDYELVLGSLSMPAGNDLDAEGLIRDVTEQQAGAVGDEIAEFFDLDPDSVTAVPAEVQDAQMSLPRIYGGSLIWNTPLSGLRVGSTLLAGDINVTGKTGYHVFIRTGSDVPSYLPRPVDIDADLDLDEVLTASLEYKRSGWTLASEYSRIQVAGDRSDGWYALADYRFSSRWAVQTYWSSAYPNAADRAGSWAEAAGYPAYYAWQHDLALAVRLDINDFWLVKFEYHHMDGAAQAQLDGLDEGETASRRWRVWTAKTTFHF